MAVSRQSPQTRFDTLCATEYLAGGVGAPSPKIRYNTSTQQWEYTNDGLTFYPIGSGTVVSGSVIKCIEIVDAIVEDTNHILPGGNIYVNTVSGNKLDVFMNGQLLRPVVLSSVGDYTEIDTTTIKFHFDVPTGTLLTYIIK